MTGIRIDKAKVLKILAKKQWTYMDLAHAMGVTKQNISVHLMSKKNIRLITLYKFANVLNVQAVDLIMEEKH